MENGKHPAPSINTANLYTCTGMSYTFHTCMLEMEKEGEWCLLFLIEKCSLRFTNFRNYNSSCKLIRKPPVHVSCDRIFAQFILVDESIDPRDVLAQGINYPSLVPPN